MDPAGTASKTQLPGPPSSTVSRLPNCFASKTEFLILLSGRPAAYDSCMGARPSNADLFLEKGQILRLRRGQGVRIACVSGLLWMTQEGDPDDWFIAAGRTMTVSAPGLTLIEALEPSIVAFSLPLPARPGG